VKLKEKKILDGRQRELKLKERERSARATSGGSDKNKNDDNDDNNEDEEANEIEDTKMDYDKNLDMQLKSLKEKHELKNDGLAFADIDMLYNDVVEA
jgi:hypothetical protein